VNQQRGHHKKYVPIPGTDSAWLKSYYVSEVIRDVNQWLLAKAEHLNQPE